MTSIYNQPQEREMLFKSRNKFLNNLCYAPYSKTSISGFIIDGSNNNTVVNISMTIFTENPLVIREAITNEFVNGLKNAGVTTSFPDLDDHYLPEIRLYAVSTDPITGDMAIYYNGLIDWRLIPNGVSYYTDPESGELIRKVN